MDVGRTHHPKPDVVVTVVRMIVVAVLGARIVLIVDPRTAAQHARLLSRVALPVSRSESAYRTHVHRRKKKSRRAARGQ
jgi:hypothetical protein